LAGKDAHRLSIIDQRHVFRNIPATDPKKIPASIRLPRHFLKKWNLAERSKLPV
jgi:hypothetical protein